MERETIGSNALPPEETARRLYKNWRERLAVPLLIGVLIFGTAALIPAVRASEYPILNAIFIGTYALTVLVTVVRFSYLARMSVFLAGIYVLGLGELFTHGILGDSLFFFLALIIFSTLLVSPRAGIAAIAFNLLTFAAAGWLVLNDRVVLLNPYAPPAKFEDWLSAGLAVVMFGAVIVLGFQRLEEEFVKAQKQIDATLNRLEEARSNLENKVQERTLLLQKVNEVAQAAAAILNPDELLLYSVMRIRDEFDCYYTAVYLLDASGQWAELKEATGEAGKVLRENRYRLETNGKSIVAKAIREKQGQIASEAERMDNPLLPYTRSQIALPLMAGNKLYGAMELHSTKEEAFAPLDLGAYQIMANGIAAALENARLFHQAQQSLLEMRAIQRQYLQNSWNTFVSETPDLEYELGDTELKQAKEIEIPLALREQILGNIQLASVSDWSPEQKSLIEAVAAQAMLALENARLVEESQSIAARERIANEIIAKIWASPNMDSILQTAVRELGRALDASEVEIEVAMQDEDER